MLPHSKFSLLHQFDLKVNFTLPFLKLNIFGLHKILWNSKRDSTEHFFNRFKTILGMKSSHEYQNYLWTVRDYLLRAKFRSLLRTKPTRYWDSLETTTGKPLCSVSFIRASTSSTVIESWVRILSGSLLLENYIRPICCKFIKTSGRLIQGVQTEVPNFRKWLKVQ